MTKEEIIKLYLSDLKNILPDSPAKRSRIIDLEEELEQTESENERLKAEREWIKIDPNVVNTIPDENVWVYWFKLNKVVFVPKGEFIPLGVISHYMLLAKPEPPKQ